MKNFEIIRSALLQQGNTDNSVVVALQEVERSLFLQKALEKTLYDSDLYLVYKHTDPNGKVYVGITKNLPNTRWNEGGGYEKQPRFRKAIQKFGWMNFKHEIIAAGLTETEARKVENDNIVALRAYDEKYGYNTQVSLPHNETDGVSVQTEHTPASSKKKEVTQEAKAAPTVDLNATAEAIISKFALKTFREKMFWPSKDGVYVKSPTILDSIKRELLVTYNLPPSKHPDMLSRIKILSTVETIPLSPPAAIVIKRDIVTEALASFCKSLNLKKGDRITNDALYTEYMNWVAKTDFTRISKTSFSKRIPNVLREVFPGAVNYRSSTTRGWRIDEIDEWEDY